MGWIKAQVGGNWISKWTAICTGTYPLPCPNGQFNTSLEFNSNDLPSGINTVPVKAVDVVGGTGHEAERTIPVKVDSDAPVIDWSGSLTQFPTQRGDLAHYGIDLAVTDGSPGSPQSGVVEVKVKVDDILVDTITQSCPTNSCAVNASWDLNASDYPVGAHVIKVEAKDSAKNLATRSLSYVLTADTASPTISLTGPYALGSATPVGANSELVVDATDVGRGVTKISIMDDGEVLDSIEQNCFIADCPLTNTFDLELQDQPGGTTTLTVEAVDGAGNVATQQVTFNLDKDAPEVELIGDLANLDGQPLSQSVGPLSILARDQDNSQDAGVARIEVTLDGISVIDHQLTCSPNCPATVTQVYQYVDDPNTDGPYDLDINVTDRAGNSTFNRITIDQPDIPVELSCDLDDPTQVPTGTVLDAEDAANSVSEALPDVVGENENIQLSEDGVVNPVIAPSEDQGSDLAELNTGYVEGQFSETAVPAIAVGGVICLAPDRTTSAALPAESINASTLIYPNTNTDTDTVVRGMASGALIVQNIRSASAPSSFTWNYSLGPDESLLSMSNGAVAIVNEEDEDIADQDPYASSLVGFEWVDDVGAQTYDAEQQLILAQATYPTVKVDAVISAPTAVDALGRMIPIQISVGTSAEQVTLTLAPDQGQTIHYPVALIARTSSRAKMRNCRPGKSPCGAFRVSAAVRYAKRWANFEKDRNNRFPSFADNDCTNFTSQVLMAGRSSFMRNFEKGQGSWWIYKMRRHPPTLYYNDIFEWTKSWALADSLMSHLWEYGMTSQVSSSKASGDSWRVGDIVAYKWDGSGDYDHLQFVTRRRNGQPYLAQHSGRDYFAQSWASIRRRIDAEHGSGWSVKIFRVNKVDGNVGEPKRDGDDA
jgi:hypothetical protein